jgi:hypothetical protein
MAHPGSERDVPSPVAHAGAGVKTLKRVLDVAYRSAYRTQCEQPYGICYCNYHQHRRGVLQITRTQWNVAAQAPVSQLPFALLYVFVLCVG